MFIKHIKDINIRLKSFTSKFADDTKVGGKAFNMATYEIIQKYLNGLFSSLKSDK